jgi:hypothetical protein
MCELGVWRFFWQSEGFFLKNFHKNFKKFQILSIHFAHFVAWPTKGIFIPKLSFAAHKFIKVYSFVKRHMNTIFWLLDSCSWKNSKRIPSCLILVLWDFGRVLMKSKVSKSGFLYFFIFITIKFATLVGSKSRPQAQMTLNLELPPCWDLSNVLSPTQFELEELKLYKKLHSFS